MMGTSLSIRVNGDGARPELLGSSAREVDGGSAIHARCLGGVGIESVGGNDLHP